MQNNTMLTRLLLNTDEKGFSRFLRLEIMNTLNGSEQEKQHQVEEMTKIVQDSKTEEEAMQKIKDFRSTLR